MTKYEEVSEFASKYSFDTHSLKEECQRFAGYVALIFCIHLKSLCWSIATPFSYAILSPRHLISSPWTDIWPAKQYTESEKYWHHRSTGRKWSTPILRSPKNFIPLTGGADGLISFWRLLQYHFGLAHMNKEQQTCQIETGLLAKMTIYAMSL